MILCSNKYRLSSKRQSRGFRLVFLPSVLKHVTLAFPTPLKITTLGAYSGTHERRLLVDLLETGYNALERPVYNDSDPINLTFGLTLQQIIDVVTSIDLI